MGIFAELADNGLYGVYLGEKTLKMAENDNLAQNDVSL